LRIRIRDGKIQIRDPGWKSPGSGSGMEKSRSRIRDKHPRSATLPKDVIFFIWIIPKKKKEGTGILEIVYLKGE
jgi:hypothetical protein